MMLAHVRTEQPKLPSIATVRRQLAEVESISSVKDVADKYEAYRVYFKKAGDSLELQNKAAEIRLWSLRRAGELLAEIVKHGGSRKASSNDENLSLRALGIDHNNSARWQKLSALGESEFEKYIEAAKSDGKEITINGAMRLATKPVQEPAEDWSLPDCLEQMRRYVEKMAQRWPQEDIAALAGQLRSLAKEVKDGTLLSGIV
jgi:hypothetical protein